MFIFAAASDGALSGVPGAGGMKVKLKRIGTEVIRHAHRMKNTLDADDATSVVSLRFKHRLHVVYLQ